MLRAAIEVARSGGHVAAEIRALANLGANTEDPSRSREVGLEAFNLAVRVGNVNLARWARESVRFSTFLLAENWDEALGQTWEEADQALGGSAALSDEARWIATTATMLIARAQPVEDLLRRLETIAGEVSDPGAAADVLNLQGAKKLISGDSVRAAELYLAAADLGSQVSHIYLSFAVRALIWSRDVEGARIAAARHRQIAPGFVLDAAIGMAADAGIAALEGRLDDGIQGYREALAQLASIHVEWLVAVIGYEFVRVVGADHPATKEAAARSREIFERIRARPWLEMLEAAIAAGRPAAPPNGRRAAVSAGAGAP